MRYYFYILLIVGFCSCNEATEKVLPSEDLNISATLEVNPSKIFAGESIMVKGIIESPKVSLGEMKLVIQHVLYSKSYSVKPIDGKFEIEIPEQENQTAGEVTLNLIYKKRLIEKEKYFIQPLNAIDKMQVFNGPKDLFAGDEDASMNVSIPHDKFENPQLPPAVVKYKKSFEGIIQGEESKAVDHLVAYQITQSKQKKGKYLIGSNSSEGFSQEQELIIGASMPQGFNIELLSFHPFADARQFLKFKTTVLKDQYDNVVADGTLVLFTVKENESIVGVYQSITIGGIAIVYIENPSKEVSWIIQASLHDQIKSNKVVLSFAKNVNDYDLSWNTEQNTLSIGPVIGILGQIVPDGSEVKITHKELEDYIYLEEGKYEYQLSFDWIKQKPNQLKVLIGGHEKTIQLD